MRTVSSLLLLLLLPTIGACFSHPRYQPFPDGSYADHAQGYEDVQLDEDTYLIVYRNYHGIPPIVGLWIKPMDHKWLQGAQQYALYRAGELAKSKGGRYFRVLYKNDWNLISASKSKKGGWSHIEPGAGLVIKVLHEYPTTIQPHGDRIYEVDTLLQDLSEKNSGLAEYLGDAHQDKTVNNTVSGYSRWRSPGGVPVGSVFTEFEPGRRIIPLILPGQFEFAMWDDRFIPPLQFLAECVKFADQERYEVFKLEDWTGEEYSGNGRVRFRTKAKMTLQHQKESDSLDAMFVVDELRSKIDVTKIKP